jgi:Domain of unknown function (DUF5658)
MMFPGYLIFFLGSIDCLTTVIGIMNSKTYELNPLMAAIIGTGIGTFVVVKIAATTFIASTYILANQTLLKAHNKDGKCFKYSSKLIKASCIGIITFLVVVIVNNLLIILA